MDIQQGDTLIIRKIIEFKLLSAGFSYQEFEKMSDSTVMFNFMILAELNELESEKIREMQK